MFEDLVKSIQSHVSDRLVSPLLGSFVVSWCVWNYKFLVILFSKETVEKSFQLINTIAYPDTSTLWLNGFAYPLVTAAAYIFLYPYPSKFVFEYTRNRQKEILEIKRRIEGETPLTIEESRKIRKEMLDLQRELYGEFDKKDKEIDRLNALVSPSTPVQPAEQIQPEKKGGIPVVTDSQMRILRQIERLKGKAGETSLISNSKETQTKTEFDLGELRRLGLLIRSYDSELRDYAFKFTHEGRSLLVADMDEPRQS